MILVHAAVAKNIKNVVENRKGDEIMSEEKIQYETDDNEQEYDLDEEKDNYSFGEEIVAGRAVEAVMNLLGITTLLITIIAAIIYFIKFKWLVGLSILFSGIVLTLIIFAISKIIELLTINTVKMTRLEEQLMELAEDGVVSLLIDSNIKIPNREARRKKK